MSGLRRVSAHPLARREKRLSLTFFADTRGQGSFYRTNEQLVRAFRKAGMNVHLRGRFDPLNRGEVSSIALLHPAWSAGDVNGVRGAHALYQRIGGMDVLNYYGIGRKAKAILDSGFFDFLCLSGPNVEAHQDGGSTQIIPWAQGIASEFSPFQHRIAPQRPQSWRPRILLEAYNPSLLRKGHDLHARVLRKLRATGRQFDIVIHGPASREIRQCFKDLPGAWLVPTYMDREHQRRLWDACDILLHLNRGGGWELMPQEAMARGLIPVIPAAEPMVTYVPEGTFFLVDTHPWWMTKADERRWDYGLDAGPGYEADEKGAVDALCDVLDGFAMYKALAAAVAKPYFSAWNMDDVMARNIELLCKVQHLRPF